MIQVEKKPVCSTWRRRGGRVQHSRALALEAMAERTPKGAAFGEELLSHVAPLPEKLGRPVTEVASLTNMPAKALYAARARKRATGSVAHVPA